MFNITETLCLEESNSRLKEKAVEQQDALQALGKDVCDLVYHHATRLIFCRIL